MPRPRIGYRRGPIVAARLIQGPRGAGMRTVTAVPGRSMRRTRHRSMRRENVVVACLSAGLTAALTGCGTQAATVAVPHKPGHAQVASAKASSPSVRDLVIAAYEGYWRATNLALASRDASKARAIMAGYVPPNSMPALVKGLQAIWRKGEIGYGGPVFHIMSVKITAPGTAAVRDCIDLSHTALANQQTGEVVGGFGQSHDLLITTLALEHGRWLVSSAIPVVQTCSY